MAGNREYKSDVFSMLMAKPEYALEVYNALNDSDYRDPKLVVLKQYMAFVSYVREYMGKYPEKDLKKAINKAIDRCIKEDVLREFLTKHRGEVTKMTQLDYTFDRRIELEREEAREEERVNTERERRAKETERQAKETERQAKETERQAKEEALRAKEKERQRAELAEIEVQKLRAELERYKRQS